MNIAENGAQRAARRAAARGLAVGAAVRAVPGIGVGHHAAPPDAKWIPYGERTYAGPGGAKPLERIDRMARYLLQRDVTTHVRHGSRWQPTPRQRRRLDHKARHAAAPFKRPAPSDPYPVTPESERLAASWGELVTNLATGEQHAEPLAAPVSPQEFARGFRVVDRRGEHRS